jgi:hypothetical protein
LLFDRLKTLAGAVLQAFNVTYLYPAWCIVDHPGCLKCFRNSGYTGSAHTKHFTCAVPRHRQNEAGVDPDTVDENRAGAALPMIAALLGSG